MNKRDTTHFVSRNDLIPTDVNSNLQTPALEETNCTGSGRIYLDQVMVQINGKSSTPLTREVVNLEFNLNPQLNKIANQDTMVEWHH